MHPYKSCHCMGCRRAGSAVKGASKRQAHRRLRHEARLALRQGKEVPVLVSTGPVS
jgi:hypothetical protein